jgi:putative RNA 2'-phosphotransferase
MTNAERRNLSKFLSLILRHQPESVGLELDDEGFVELEDLQVALRRNRSQGSVTQADVLEVVETSDKQRFEVVGDRIRARYGHSVEQKMAYDPVTPPEILYHGTSPHAVPNIRRQGLQPMKRQYVHLSVDTEQARAVGKRHHRQPAILTVHAKRAWDAGVTFYHPEERLFLAESIPPEFIVSEG